MADILRHRGKELVQVFLSQGSMDHLQVIKRTVSKRKGVDLTLSEIIEGLITNHQVRQATRIAERKHDLHVARKRAVK